MFSENHAACRQCCDGGYQYRPCCQVLDPAGMLLALRAHHIHKILNGRVYYLCRDYKTNAARYQAPFGTRNMKQEPCYDSQYRAYQMYPHVPLGEAEPEAIESIYK